jgi:hypothetical protein
MPHRVTHSPLDRLAPLDSEGGRCRSFAFPYPVIGARPAWFKVDVMLPYLAPLPAGP